MADSQPKDRPFDLIQRGVKRTSVPGILTFVGLRGLDPILQYKLIAGGWGASLLSKLGLNVVLPLTAASNTGIALIDNLNLPLPHLILLGMSVGSFAKQAYWSSAANSLLFLAASTSVLASPLYFPGTSMPYQVVLGSALFGIGMFLETASEEQRKHFKAKPENQGKVIREGLWSWALTSTMVAFDFVSRAVPVLNEYCTKRYGEQWNQFKKETKWVILPGIY
ncbi:membrane protein [Colletotrichum kahawae]|uniref:Membrane protein n=1 Tax=Colletotrichum kahawae TaxID=34407 RepID=A0AAD9YSN7_COLKA|nr:membrane protein [Colletotrichum kahawae]